MPDACIALPTAKIAVMGPQAAVNAVYANKIAAIADPDERAAFIAEKRAEYEEDVDLMRLAADLVLDVVIEPERPARRAAAPLRRARRQVAAPRRPSGTASRRCESERAQIEVRGNASAEELAAVLAVVARADDAGARSEPDAYTRWRRVRLRALRPTAPPAEHRAR